MIHSSQEGNRCGKPSLPPAGARGHPMANATSTANRNLWCVVYRMGGTANFTWHRCEPMTAVRAAEARGEIARMGYKAMVVNYTHSLAIGLPETYE
jgi:hypothetical protein